ncbi:uncharacterized protein LOC132740084 [Ruditapes philippinarum]|uniref:uncharacterized protein LOC132740084 n=1 Tax=Ruditapes philippinarum TaxID=129788 RepID=UPI00295AFE66|nr:uncharacterized protein LOC132740084 [Ruditapes philippinarum]
MKSGIVLELVSIHMLLLLVAMTTGVSTKKGVVHIGRDYLCGDFGNLNSGIVSWYDYLIDLTYFRSKEIEQNCATNIYDYSDKFVAMVWGLDTNLDKTIAGSTVFGYNEPNHETQSNITATLAAESWGNITQKFPGKTYGSPSASKCGGQNCLSDDVGWFDEFFQVCEQYNCHVDFLITHTYMCDADAVLSYLEFLSVRYSKNIWLKEFSCGQIKSKLLMKIFMQQILPKLEEAPFIIGYNWYKSRLVEEENGTDYVYPAASLLHANNNSLTELGQIYINYNGGALPVEVIPKPNAPAEALSLLINEKAANREDLTGADEIEALAILKVFLWNPTDWPDILYSIKQQYNNLQETVAAYYMTATKKDVKARIREVFEVLMCTHMNHILDKGDLRTEVQRVQSLEYNITGLEKKGRLKIPAC